MSTLLSTIAEAKLKIRWLEPYVSGALNKVVGTLPRGIVYGFDPTPGAGLTLTLSMNGAMGHSAMRVRDSTDKLAVLYLEEADVSLDLTAHAGTTVYIGVTVDYDTGAATTAEIRAYSTVEYNAGVTDAVWVCGIAVPGVAPILTSYIDTSVATIQQDEPYNRNWGLLREAGNDKDLLVTPMSAIDISAEAQMAVVTDGTVASGKSYRVLWISGTPDKYAVIAMVPIAEGDYLRVSWSQKLTAATATTVGLFIQWLDASEAVLSSQWVGSSATASTTGWTSMLKSVVAPAGAISVLVSIGTENIAAGTVYFSRPTIHVRDTGSRRYRTPIVDYSVLALTLVGRDPSKKAQAYVDSDTDVLNFTNSGNAAKFSGDLEVTGDLTLSGVMKRTKKWIGGRMIAPFIAVADQINWATPTATGLTRSGANSGTLYVPIDDLPLGARIVEVGVSADESLPDLDAVLTITLRRVSYSGGVTATNLGTATVTGSGAVTVSTTDTDGAGDFEVRDDEESAYFLEVTVNNDNTANVWVIQKIWLNWELELVTPAGY